MDLKANVFFNCLMYSNINQSEKLVVFVLVPVVSVEMRTGRHRLVPLTFLIQRM